VSQAVLGLGGNLGARRALFSCARALLAAQPGLRVLAASPLYHTPPLGPPQPEYLNAALLVDWVGEPRSLLAVTQHVEALLQRQRQLHWGPRTLDLDLLYWVPGEVREPDLRIPHRELQQRSFALAPLLDVLPELQPRYRSALSRLGGVPARAETWAARFERDGQELVTATCDEPAELVSALASALASLFQGFAAARSVLPFRCPEPGGLSDPVGWQALEQRLRAAFASGFFVVQAAVSDASEGTLSGVFVGQHGGRPASLPALRIQLESHGSAMRARVRESLGSALWP
jgi:2-amino-4-hydroxy-6-hydroxymethyldihydropteridine diphosphokinase